MCVHSILNMSSSLEVQSIDMIDPGCRVRVRLGALFSFNMTSITIKSVTFNAIERGPSEEAEPDSSALDSSTR